MPLVGDRLLCNRVLVVQSWSAVDCRREVCILWSARDRWQFSGCSPQAL